MKILVEGISFIVRGGNLFTFSAKTKSAKTASQFGNRKTVRVECIGRTNASNTSIMSFICQAPNLSSLECHGADLNRIIIKKG